MTEQLHARSDRELDERRVRRREIDQDRTMLAIGQLEQALAQPSPARERSWRHEVLGALEVLDEATTSESANSAQPDSLLSDLALHQPHLRNRVRGLKAQYRHIQDVIGEIRGELSDGEDPGPDLDVDGLRRRIAGLVTDLRLQRARESDLIYEAYYDAFRSDLLRYADRELGPKGQ